MTCKAHGRDCPRFRRLLLALGVAACAGALFLAGWSFYIDRYYALPPALRLSIHRYPIPAGTRVDRDIEYVSSGGERRSLDLYLPPPTPQPPPLVVWIHGGSWLSGDKSNPPAVLLVAHGYAVASINYRYSTEAVFPAQIIDCKSAVRFLRARAADYGFDPDRIAAMGMSAGGHLASLLGTARESEDLGGDEVDGVSSRVQAVVVWAGPSDFLLMNRQALPGSSIDHEAPDQAKSLLIGGPVRQFPDRVRRANPLAYASADDPPFLIMHGDADLIVPPGQSVTLAEGLRAAGVDARLILIPRGRHDEAVFTHRQWLDRVVEFLSRSLRNSR